MPTVDTLVAQHLLKTVAAARLMGADCIISGIRPQIAQTIVHLGVDLGAVVTKATLADAFARRAAAQRSHRDQGAGVVSAMERIPILKMGAFLLVSIQVDMHDRLAMSLQDDLTAQIVKTRARECSSTSRRSRWWIRSSAGCSATSRRCRASSTRRPCVVGMQPAVAITLVELGMSLPGVRTALNVEKGHGAAAGGHRRRAIDGAGDGD